MIWHKVFFFFCLRQIFSPLFSPCQIFLKFLTGLIISCFFTSVSGSKMRSCFSDLYYFYNSHLFSKAEDILATDGVT